MKTSMKNLQRDEARRSWIVYPLLGVLAVLLFGRSPSPGTRISYSEFKQRIEAGQIAEVEIGRDRLRAIPSDPTARAKGTRFTVVRVEDPDLVRQLEGKKIAFSGLQEADWLNSFLVAWLLPMLLFGGFWF